MGGTPVGGTRVQDGAGRGRRGGRAECGPRGQLLILNPYPGSALLDITVHGRDFTSMLDLSPEELALVLDTALAVKRDGSGPVLAGRTLALLFEKPSLRTRVSFEVAMARLGGRALYLSDQEVRMGIREPAKDIARVLSRMVDGIVVRTFAHQTLAELAQWASVPIVNALSDDEHPCQALADLLTLREHLGVLHGARLAYVGEGNNVAVSLAYASVLAGMQFTCASPEGYGLPPAVLEQARALPGGGSARQSDDPHEAVREAQAVYTDVWASMGQEHRLDERREAFTAYRLDAALLASAPADALVMHDLPAHRGEEITDEVIESPRTVVFDQAENRVHAQQAMLLLLLGRPAAQ
ncbi:MAG: ornithine carbamoyltransferase [Dehalococcoidia bacterium]|nr:ornithine carbamoyltransferase [Dehalococcoidia bacterium]